MLTVVQSRGTAAESDTTPPPPSAAGRALQAAWEADGLCALLITDLEGFTSLVEQLGDERAVLLIQDHDRLVRGCIRDHGGREVAHTGDGVMAAFRSINAALAAACDIQRKTTAHTEHHPDEPLRVRIGVHAGEPLASDGRLIGTCVNTTARICNAAAPARVLVTDLARKLASGSRFRFQAAGTLKLKGLTAAVAVHELAWS